MLTTEPVGIVEKTVSTSDAGVTIEGGIMFMLECGVNVETIVTVCVLR